MRFDAKRKVRRRAKRAIYPRTLELDYGRAIKRRLRAAAKGLKRRLDELGEFRTDSASDERSVERAIGSLKIAYYEHFTEEKTERLALETANRVEGYMDRQFTRQFKSVLGVDPMPTRSLRRQALRFVEENVSLIRSVEEEYFERLQEDITKALREGARWEQLAPTISERYRVSGRRAELIARDQMGSLVSQVAQSKQQSAGFDKYIWRNSQDSRVVGNPSGLYPEGNDAHGDHWSREGEVFSWSNPPHDGHPGEPINCRCTAEPYWDDEEEEESDSLSDTESDATSLTSITSVSSSAPSARRIVGAGSGIPEDFYDKARPTDRIKPQEKEYSCGVACVRQVLEDEGINVTEKELRDKIGYDFYENNLKGVSGKSLSKILKAHEFNVKEGAVSLETARSMLQNGADPYIALIENHWVIVDSTDNGIVNVRDPWGLSGPGSKHGIEGEIAVDKFLNAWIKGRLGIIIW